MLRRTLGLLLFIALAAGCSSRPPVSAHHASARAVHRSLTESALSARRPSAWTNLVLHRRHLTEVYRKEPAVALAELHGLLGQGYDNEVLFALAELSFLNAERRSSQERFLASAVYAYAFLFPANRPSGLNPLDPRVRIAADLYNRALTESLKIADTQLVDLDSARFPLPFGSIDIAFDDRLLSWAGYPLGEVLPAAEYKIRGLRNRYRQPGIGAPFAASLERPKGDERALPSTSHIPRSLKVPITALLRIEQPRESLLSGQLRGRLEVYSLDDEPTVEIEGFSRPVEAEPSAALALSLARAKFWELERKAFFAGTWTPRGGGFRPGLMLLRPYRPGLVPVVLVHGTASSPGRWAEMVNELENDAVLGRRIQLWLFLYNSGNPVGYSAGLLAESLKDLVTELDPEGTDAALHDVVVIGHSQGGMLTRLMATDSGDIFWENISDEPLDGFRLKPDDRKVIERSLFFEPLPFVKRVVFISTPHQGSYLTMLQWGRLRPSNIIGGLIKTPVVLAQATLDLVTANASARLERAIDRMPTSIDNMTPGNPFLQTLSALPIAPGVPYHSIISVKGNGPAEKGNDGVVQYSSAHLDGASSELVVRSGHSTQGTPETIEEVRRILRLHIGVEPPP